MNVENKNGRKHGVNFVTTKVQKWGNSLGIRIPSEIAESLAIYQTSEVELSIENNVLLVKPIRKKPTLNDLLSQITDDNRHQVIDYGLVEGKELL
jgi:antitoxin MazE